MKRNNKVEEERTCPICGTVFFSKLERKRFCSEKCCKTGASKRHAAKRKEERHARGFVSKRGPYRKSSTKDRKRVENVPVDEMIILNKNPAKSDKEKLKRKEILSPDHTQMPFSIHDPKLRITRYFKTKEKYEHHLLTLKEQ